MDQAKIIEYIDQGSLICTLCLQDKGNRLHLLTPLNREVNLSPKRALLISNVSIDPLSPREELLNKLKQIEDLRTNLQEKVLIEELWELVRDENDSFDYKYLAQICFSGDITDDHISAMVRALFEDKLYFKIKDGRIYPNSREKVDQILQQREEEALREEILKQGGEWLQAIVQNKKTHDPPNRDAIISLLTELVLYQDDAPHVKYGKDLLSRGGISTIDGAREVLVRLGIWEEDENLDLLRKDIKTSFNERQLKESEALAGANIAATGYEDLRHLQTVTVDGPFTQDFDDALSLEWVGDTVELGVHIADVAGAIPEDSLTYDEASQRVTTLYLPRRQIPMLPPNLSHDTLSLKQGCDRPAISLISRFSKSGDLLSYRFVPSIVRVERQLTYDQVNERYEQDDTLQRMFRLSRILHQKRIEQGALILSLPEVFIQFGMDASISIEMIPQETPSRVMVAEFMILYNWLAAIFCRDHNIPILYRCQEAPSEILPVDRSDYVFYVFQQRRKLNPLLINTAPKPHKGLGLDAYTNVSSPIRRFLDLVVQGQIRNFLLKKPPAHDVEDLEKIRMSVEPVAKDLERMKRNRLRYWIQKYLRQHIGEKFPAIVLYRMKKKVRILLTDFLLVTEMKRENGPDFIEGDHLMVKIKESDPWNDALTVEYAG